MNINEIIEKYRLKFKSIKEELENIEAQVALRQLIMPCNDQEEHYATYNIHEIFSDYAYLVNRIIYHGKNYLLIISDIMDRLIQFGVEINSEIFLNHDIIGYEFESYIAAINKIIEQPVPDTISNNLDKNIKKVFPQSMIQKSNTDGLYWRMNILRNRVVHPDEAKYATMDKYAYKYYGFSAQPLGCKITKDSIEWKCTLFDLDENEFIKEIIKDEILIKNSDKNIIDILFEQKSPKGYGKKEPRLLFYGDKLKRFDYFNSFINFTNTIHKYMSDINHCLMRQNLKGQKEEIKDKKLKYSETEEKSINDVFQL
jgi:hypothetical protein